MSKFYTIDHPPNRRLRLYSERGLLTHFFHDMLVMDPVPMLEAAKNSDGGLMVNILDIGALKSFTVYTEFELGPQGFGSPDGGLLLVGERRRAFIFIEGKAIPFAHSFKDPELTAKPIQNRNWQALDLEPLMRQNKFNSSINGQIELKWRFVNALRAHQAEQGVGT